MRGLSSESIPKFAKALKLNKQEADFFESLVLFNQASSAEEKTRYYARMTHNRRYREIKGLEKEFSEFASTAARINQFNELLAKQRDDFTRLLEESEKKHKERQSELVRRHSDEVRPFRTEIDELKKSIDLGPIQRELKARATDILRLRDEIGKLQPQIDEARRLQESGLPSSAWFSHWARRRGRGWRKLDSVSEKSGTSVTC